MGITFQSHRANACCLCGSADNLTGEHKIKASALREVFGSDKMVIGTFGEPDDARRTAQGPKSKEFHFDAPVCAPCNNVRSQPADQEFSRFHRIVRDLLDRGENPKDVFKDTRYTVGTAAYLNVFRYFTKLLCCHMAGVNAPRSERLSRFATGQSNAICVWLDIDEDVTFKDMAAEFGISQYAAHGGLIVYGNKRTGGANGFHSTLTIGRLRYIFFSRLHPLERLELRFGHRQFHLWCREQVELAKSQPIPTSDQVRLGLMPREIAIDDA